MTDNRTLSPPGDGRPPLIATVLDTAEFSLGGWEPFFTRRRKKYGSTVFRIHLFKPMIAVLDRTGITPLFGDPDLIQDHAFGWAKPPPGLLGDMVPSVFEHGAAHDVPKSFFLTMVKEAAPRLSATFERVADPFFAQWSTQKNFAFGDALEDFSMSLAFEWILGARPNIQAARQIYNNLFFHPFPQLEKLWPWSSYAKSVPAYADLIAFIRTAPRFRQLADLARAHDVDEQSLPHRLAFVLGMNSFLGLQSTLKSLIGELSRQAALHHELSAGLQNMSEPQIFAQPLLDGFLREVLRLHPPVFFIFGRATRDRALDSVSGTFAIKAGELVMGVLPLAQRDPALFAQPNHFDPNRYHDIVARNGLIWPRGSQDANVQPTDRTCPGKDPALLIAKLFCARLVTNYRWRLARPPQWSTRHYGLNVAAPVGALNVKQFQSVR